jgi:hypothetical protein
MRYSVALLGLILSSCFIVGWGMAMGANPFPVILFLTLFYSVMIVLARLVVEGGLYVVTAPAPPQEAMMDIFGAARFDIHSHTAIGQLKIFSLRYGQVMTAYLFAAFRLARGRNISRRGLAACMMIGLVAALMVGFPLTLMVYHANGAAKLDAWRSYYLANEPFDFIRQIQNDRLSPDSGAIGWMSGGLVLTLALTLVRIHVPWWPLHPIGYVVNSTYMVQYMWPYFFIAFILMRVVSRYWGAGAISKMRRFFLGMILGHFVSAGLSWGICFLLNHRGYWVV